MPSNPTNAPARPTLPVALLGLVCTVLIAWGTCNPEFAFNPAGWPNDTVTAIGRALPHPVDCFAILIGALGLAAVWLWIAPRGNHVGVRHPVGVLATWIVPFVLAPPILSSDMTLYADAGYMVTRGVNPYIAGLTAAGGPWAPLVDELWAHKGVAYPPGTLLVDAVVSATAGNNPYLGLLLMRVPALIGIALMVAGILGICRARGVDPDVALWWGALNPLLVVHFAGGGHNDALMAGVSLCAIWLVLARKTPWVEWLWAPVLVGIAMCLKQQGGLTILAVSALPVLDALQPATLRERVRLLLPRLLGTTAVVVAVFAAVSSGSGLGYGWSKWLSVMQDASTAAPFSMLAKSGASWFGGDPAVWARVIPMVSSVTVLVVLIAILIRFSARPIHAVGWGSMAVSVLGMALHPWYIPWSLSLLGLDRLTRRQRVVLIVFVIAFLGWNTYQSTIFYKVR